MILTTQLKAILSGMILNILSAEIYVNWIHLSLVITNLATYKHFSVTISSLKHCVLIRPRTLLN